MLIIEFLDAIYKLYYNEKLISSDFFKINGVSYFLDENSKNGEGFIGFYDWLRLNPGTIVGIRICYFEDQPYNDILSRYPYVVPVFGNKCMEILFRDSKFDSTLSGDQDFTNNYVYKSENDNYLFTFSLNQLNEEELNSLIQNCNVLSDDQIASFVKK